MLGGARARLTTAGSGPSAPEPCGSFGPDGHYLKTSPDFFPSTTDVRSEKFSEIWPRSGMMRSGTVFPLPTWVPPTAENGSGSWPTPKEQNARSYSPKRDDLSSRADQWATPTSRDHKDTGSLANVPENALLGRQASNFAPGPTGSPSEGPTAPSASSPVKPWATPVAAPDAPNTNSNTKNDIPSPGGQAKAWATPAAGDEIGSHGGGMGRSIRTDTHGFKAKGQKAAYNPRFGLALMGFPADWLDAPVFEATKPSRGKRPAEPKAGTPDAAACEGTNSSPAVKPKRGPRHR